MVLPGLAGADPDAHQPREGGKDVDRRVDAAAEEVAREDDLPLGDVAGQVGDRVGDVVVGHGQDRDLGDRAAPPLDPPGALVERREVRVHVARVAAPARHLLAGGRDLAKGLAVVGHVGQDHEHVHVVLVGEVLGRREGAPRGGDPLDGRVVGEVQEEDHALERAGLLELPGEEGGLLPGDPHRGEDDGEGALLLEDPALPGDLGREPVRGQPRAREDRQLLAADQGVQPVDRRDTGLDEVRRLVPGVRVDRHPVDVGALLGDDGRPAIAEAGPARRRPARASRARRRAGTASPVKRTRVSAVVDAARPLEDLDHGGLARDLEHLPGPRLAVGQRDRAHLAVRDPTRSLHEDERARDVADRPVLLRDEGPHRSASRARAAAPVDSISSADLRLVVLLLHPRDLVLLGQCEDLPERDAAAHGHGSRLVERQDRPEHQVLLLHRAEGVDRAERALLQEVLADHPRDLEDGLLALGQGVGPDELDDLLELGLFLEEEDRPDRGACSSLRRRSRRTSRARVVR